MLEWKLGEELCIDSNEPYLYYMVDNRQITLLGVRWGGFLWRWRYRRDFLIPLVIGKDRCDSDHSDARELDVVEIGEDYG